MVAKFDREQFERVFSDAHVIDIDFSAWDKALSFWVLADHFEEWTSRCPLVVVEFIDIHTLSISFKHHAISLGDPAKHVQWRIDDFTAAQRSDLIRVTLLDSASSPATEIVCSSINVRPVPHALLDSLFPGWNKPFSAFARPGVEAIAKVLQLKKRP